MCNVKGYADSNKRAREQKSWNKISMKLQIYTNEERERSVLIPIGVLSSDRDYVRRAVGP